MGLRYGIRRFGCPPVQQRCFWLPQSAKKASFKSGRFSKVRSPDVKINGALRSVTNKGSETLNVHMVHWVMYQRVLLRRCAHRSTRDMIQCRHIG